MAVKEITYTTFFRYDSSDEEISEENDVLDEDDIENSNISVDVLLDNGCNYTVTVGTAKNIHYLMERDQMNYFEPGEPFIIVRQLTIKIVEEAIHAYAETQDGYCLKLHHFATSIDPNVFKDLEDKQKLQELQDEQELRELDEEDNF
jgi:hypothetical protein